MTAFPEIGAVLVCDDVRKEVSNKDILIGVYAADILVPTFPAWVNIAVWLEVIPKETGSLEMSVRLSIDGKPAVIVIGLQMNSLSPVGVALPGVQVLAEKESEILVEVKEGDNWRVLKRKKVIKGVFKLPLSGPAASATGTS